MGEPGYPVELTHALNELEQTLAGLEYLVETRQHAISPGLAEVLRGPLLDINAALIKDFASLGQQKEFPKTDRSWLSKEVRIQPKYLEHYPVQRRLPAYYPIQGLLSAWQDLERTTIALKILIDRYPQALPSSLAETLTHRLHEMNFALVKHVGRFERQTRLTKADLKAANEAAKPYELWGVTSLPGQVGLLVIAGQTRLSNRRAELDVTESTHGDQSEISVFAYLDTDDQRTISEITDQLDQLVDVLGYEGPHDEEIERGSFIRRSRAFLLRGLSSAEVQQRLIKVERALELAALDMRQAEVDDKTADAVAKLLTALKDVDRAVLRAGSVLLIKHPASQGPVVVVRTLSQLEIRAFERYPEIQLHPERTLEALASAVAALSDPSEHEITEGG